MILFSQVVALYRYFYKVYMAQKSAGTLLQSVYVPKVHKGRFYKVYIAQKFTGTLLQSVYGPKVHRDASTKCIWPKSSQGRFYKMYMAQKSTGEVLQSVYCPIKLCFLLKHIIFYRHTKLDPILLRYKPESFGRH